MAGLFDGCKRVETEGRVVYFNWLGSICGKGWDLVVATDDEYLGRTFLASYDEAPENLEVRGQWLYELARKKAHRLLRQHEEQKRKKKELENEISAAIKNAVEIGIYWHRSCGATELYTVFHAPDLPVPRHDIVGGQGEDFARGKVYFRDIKDAQKLLASSQYTEEAGRHAVIELLVR